MKKQRVFAAILAIILAASTMVGCNDTNNPVSSELDNSEIEMVTVSPEPSDDIEPTIEPEVTLDVTPNVDTNIVPETSPEPTPSITDDEENMLTETQKNSIAMLNYLAVLSQEVNSSKNSRLFLEEAYASLINNTNPENVNELTESHMSSLLDIIERYRMINVKRERLQYLYDQNKAHAIRQAMPNPVALLSLTNSRNLKSLAASAIYMAVDSVNSYKSYNDELDNEFLQEGWALDDEEAENLHDSRKRAFTFMIEIVREDDLPGELALNETSVNDFVKWKNNSNNIQRLQFFESEEKTYSAFGNYWLVLAECYYENGEYDKCIESVTRYEEIQAGIFRKDYYLAQIMPYAIAAASELYQPEEYIPFAEKYVEIILNNTENTEWSLRTFAAQVYMDLYALTNDTKYIESAYSVTLNNVNYLVNEQRSLNELYLADVSEVSIPEDATKEEKKQIKEYNKELKTQRKTELPAVYEPLKVNCDILFALAKELNIADKEINRIEGILCYEGEEAFMTLPLREKYSFRYKMDAIDAKFESNKLTVPAGIVTKDSIIKVTVTDGSTQEEFSDWLIESVERPQDDIESFKAIFTSKGIKEREFKDKTKVNIQIFDNEDADVASVVLNFEAKMKKNLFVINTISFEQVK